MYCQRELAESSIAHDRLTQAHTRRWIIEVAFMAYFSEATVQFTVLLIYAVMNQPASDGQDQTGDEELLR